MGILLPVADAPGSGTVPEGVEAAEAADSEADELVNVRLWRAPWSQPRRRKPFKEQVRRDGARRLLEGRPEQTLNAVSKQREETLTSHILIRLDCSMVVLSSDVETVHGRRSASRQYSDGYNTGGLSNRSRTGRYVAPSKRL